MKINAMNNWEKIKLGDLYLKNGKSVDPAKFPNETFDLYSIPAYDRREPEVVEGKNIGSSKKALRPNDVIISRIVPHIRRCWIIPENNGHRQIGSSEWIVFRSNKIEPSFLRYYLLSDDFNTKFLGTVKGVGGSLLRADPKQVARFEIPLPPLPVQRHLAAILDAADALRQRDRELIAKYEELTRAVFSETFGTLDQLRKWELINFGDIIRDGPTNGLYKPAKNYGSGAPIVRIDSFYNSVISLENLKRVQVNDNELNRFQLDISDFLVNRVNSRSHLGKCGVVASLLEETVYESNIMRIKLDTRKIDIYYLLYLWSSSFIKNQILNACKDAVNQSSINQNDVKNIVIPLPPIALQHQFAAHAAAIESQRVQAQAALAQSEALFQSLLQRAFKGELVTNEIVSTIG